VKALLWALVLALILVIVWPLVSGRRQLASTIPVSSAEVLASRRNHQPVFQERHVSRRAPDNQCTVDSETIAGCEDISRANMGLYPIAGA
jgi:hypothetical protein